MEHSKSLFDREGGPPRGKTRDSARYEFLRMNVADDKMMAALRRSMSPNKLELIQFIAYVPASSLSWERLWKWRFSIRFLGGWNKSSICRCRTCLFVQLR
jgi:hypothetical protein